MGGTFKATLIFGCDWLIFFSTLPVTSFSLRTYLPTRPRVLAATHLYFCIGDACRVRQLPEAVRERGHARELLREAAENVPAPPHGAALRNAQVGRIGTFLLTS